MAQQNISITKATVNGDSGAWGTKTNAALDVIVAAVNNTDLTTDPRPGKLNNRGAWAPSTAYAVGDVVKQNNRVYVCPVAFTSGATFSTANWVDSGSDIASTTGASTVGAAQTALLANVGYITPFLNGSISNQTLDEGNANLARMTAGRAFAAGAAFTASIYLATAGTTGALFRPLLYKIDPTTQTGLTLLADFGALDVSTTSTNVKTSASTALLGAIAVGDHLAVGGAQQGAAATRGNIQCAGGFDNWFPFTIGVSRPQGLAVAGVTGAGPSTPTATVKLTSATAVVPVVSLTSLS